PQHIISIGGSQITQGGVAFPDRQLAVLQDRHQAIGVHGAIGWLIQPAMAAAHQPMGIGQIQLLESPQGFLHIGRAGTAPKRQIWTQRALPSEAAWYCTCRRRQDPVAPRLPACYLPVMSTSEPSHIVGGGLAGSEAAWQAA